MTQGERPDPFEVLDIAVIETGARDHRVRRANPAACALLGRSEAEVIGLTWDDVAVGDDGERWKAQARLRVAAGQSRTRMIIRLLRPDGTIVHALATIALLTDPDGEQYFLSHFQDVSEEIAAQDRLRLVVENTPVSMFLVDRTGRVLVSEGTANPQAAAGLGEARESSVFETFADLPQAVSIMRRAVAGERIHEIMEAFGRCLDVHLVPIPGNGSNVGSVAAVATDITERQQALASLQARSAEQAVVADLGQRALEARDPAPLWDRAVTALADRLRADLVQAHELDESGDRCRLLARADRRAAPATPPLGPPVETVPVETVPVETVPVETPRPVDRLTVNAGRPDRPLAVIEIQRATDPFTDQDSRFVQSVAAVLGSAGLRLQMESDIRRQSRHDGLTGLPNRTALLERLERALRRAYRDGRRIGVLFLDLDGFKAINDTLGHQAGDDLLRATATRLARAVRPGDVVGRLAGDEFAVLCEAVDGPADLEAIAERILATLETPSRLLGHCVVVTGSVGLALSGPDLQDSENLLNAADIAMYAAKRDGPGRHRIFQESMRTRLMDQLTRADDLRRAQDAHELTLRYQPIRTPDGALAGAEAIPHWQQPSNGLLRLDEILPRLRQADLRVSIIRWALDTAGRAASSEPGWPDRPPGGPPLLMVAAWGPCITDERFVPELATLLHDTGGGTRYRLCVELDEDELGTGRPAVTAALADIRRLGVLVGVGDPRVSPAPRGLLGLPFDGLRIADGYVRGVERDRTKHAAVASVIHFAHLLGAQVIAGDVEDPAQLRVLQELDCDLVEGPLLDPDGPQPSLPRGGRPGRPPI
ncbi:sensor domain-containing protein [Frankia tisae]|uniref:sensor domain-containing protein n=1 Tax=Frankia tisae TaxID=2950104 RepID=UPI0021C11DC3|nr:diguanylate cyclase [Frankia tisae]